VLPPVEGETPEGLDAIAGLILPGGGDVDPEHYGGGHHDANYGISQERDRFELTLMRAALARRALPVLCVCRGMQLLNVALGGDLIAHIPDHFGDSVVHRAPQLKPIPHGVRLDPCSRLAGLLSAVELVVQSVHHQAVGRLGEGLRAVGWSDDGVVEAIESERHPFVVGVQWHPELDALSDPRPMRLFEELVAQAQAYRQP
jgi:putative glutamine amidotransferase